MLLPFINTTIYGFKLSDNKPFSNNTSLLLLLFSLISSYILCSITKWLFSGAIISACTKCTGSLLMGCWYSKWLFALIICSASLYVIFFGLLSCFETTKLSQYV